MILRKSTIWLAALLVLAALLAQPAAVEAQCSITTNTGMYTIAGMSVMYVLKYLSAAQVCTLTMQMNVIDCAPNPSAITDILSATAYVTAASPSCAWVCACGSVTIDGSDNLPVELMEFSVEDETARDAEGAGQDDGAAGADEGAA